MSRQVVETIWQDLRYGWRGLLHAPGFVLTVTMTIALGLGVNTALFTLFDANYLRPILVRDPQSLYEIFWIDRSGNVNDFSWPEYREFLAQNPAFSEAAALYRAEARLAGRHLLGVLVTDDYFRMLGVRAELGRTLLPGDASNSATPVVVLSHTTWQSQFGGVGDIVGKKILLRGHHFEVVGVAPPEFTGLGDPTDFWAPITLASVFDPSSDLFGLSHPRALGIVARLKSGFTIRQAENGVALWARRFTADLPAAEEAMAATSVSRATRKPFNPRNNAAFFSLVLLAFAVILVIACTNVANMMLARSVARQREIGVRLSLGASRGRLIRQLLTESTLMVLPSAALGILLSRGIIKACLWLLVTTLPPGIAGFINRIPPLSPDIRVLAFSLAAAFSAAIVCGLAPALQSTRTNLTQAARGDFGNNWRPSRVTNALLAGQIVVCVLMLVTAGVVLRGIKGVQVLDATLSTRNAIELVIQEDSRAMVLDRISREPALWSLAAASSAPVERKTIASVKSASGAILASAANSVSPEYFSTFDIHLLRGRNFTAEEARSGSPVVLLSQTAASQLWPNQEPGRSLDLVADQAASAEFRRNQTVAVVGIVGDEPSRWIANGESKAIIYFPADSKTPGTRLFLGVHGDAEPVMHRLDADLTDALEEIDALQIRRWVIEEAYSFHVVYWVAIALASLALLLTLSGIYGVVAHIVSQRTKEIGIRMALGATTRSVERLVLKQSMRLAVPGGIVGCMLALGVSKILSSILLMINTYDVAVYAGGIAFVWMACAAAAYLPARRVARVDPASTLRYD
ncbi:MAG TPA: ADOP family duplicated permease [Candidatus Acidoferrum sp.]